MSKLAGDHVQVMVDGYELTSDYNRIAINDARKLLNQTTFGDGVENFIAGQRQVSMEHAGFMNAAVGRSHPVLKGAAVNGVVSVMLGQNADPATGDPVYCLDTQQSQYSVSPQFGDIVQFGASFANTGNRGGWGTALAVPTSFTNSSNGSSVDNGAASGAGGSAYLHVLQAAASDTYAITVEGSATGAFGGEESTLAGLHAGRLGAGVGAHCDLRIDPALCALEGRADRFSRGHGDDCGRAAAVLGATQGKTRRQSNNLTGKQRSKEQWH